VLDGTSRRLFKYRVEDLFYVNIIDCECQIV
jgi:hypothetical protein